MTPDELPVYLNKMKDRIGKEGPPAAAYAMARRFHEYVSDDVLVRSSHKPQTPTPSAPGSPPALVTGALKRSLRLYPALPIGPYRAKSKVTPHIVYARIQEEGGTIVPHHLRWENILDKYGKPRRVLKGMLHWKMSGKDFFATKVTLPKRPYMRPGHRDTVRDGSLRRAAADAVRKLIY